jgi:hypothetical protein
MSMDSEDSKSSYDYQSLHTPVGDPLLQLNSAMFL